MSPPDLPGRLRNDLTAAMRERDRESVRVLRTVLSAIANAEAQPDLDDSPTSARSSGPIAGATHGLGAGEVARRQLDASDVRAIVLAERDERLTAAADLADRGAPDAAEALRAEAALLERYLG